MPLLKMADGSFAHIKGTGLRSCSAPGCNVVAGYQCDYPMGKGRTCDAHLCEDHAIVQGRRPSMQLRLGFVDDGEIPADEAVHFCPAHHLIAPTAAHETAPHALGKQRVGGILVEQDPRRRGSGAEQPAAGPGWSRAGGRPGAGSKTRLEAGAVAAPVQGRGRDGLPVVPPVPRRHPGRSRQPGRRGDPGHG